jgi:hypothetical protein
MECDICLNNWDSDIYIPRILTCGHTFCEFCLKRIISSKKIIKCPSCQLTINDIQNENEIKNLIKNINLLQIAEKLSHSRNNNDSHSNMTSIRGSNNNNFNLSLSSLLNKKEAFELDYNPCLDDSLEVQISLMKIKISILKDFLITYMNQSESENESKLEQIFDYLNKVLIYNYNTAKTVLNQCKKEQTSSITTHLQDIQLIESKIKEIEESLVNLGEKHEKINEKINQSIHERMNEISSFLEKEMKLLNIELNYKNKFREEIFDLIQNSYQIDANYEKNINIYTILKHNWICLCGDINNNSETLKCKSCNLFRKFETFTDADTNLIKSRKKLETEDFQALLKKENDGKYYMISLRWYMRWKNFIMNMNEADFMITYPGPVDNSDLIILDTLKLRPDLTKTKDYILVNKPVWEMLYRNYNANYQIELKNKNCSLKETNIIINFVKFKYRSNIEMTTTNSTETYNTYNNVINKCSLLESSNLIEDNKRIEKIISENSFKLLDNTLQSEHSFNLSQNSYISYISNIDQNASSKIRFYIIRII